MAGGNTEQLRNHLLRAKANGLTETELKEAIIHLAFYAGWPRAMSAITVAKSRFAERDHPPPFRQPLGELMSDLDIPPAGGGDYRRLVGDRRGHCPCPGSHGYRVALLARRVDRLRAAGRRARRTAVAIAADVTDRDALSPRPTRSAANSAGADVLVNNAGVMLLGPFGTDQRAEARRMVEVNLLGAMTATEVFLDQLRDGGGDLMNISSVAGRTARAGNAAYAATKWGMNGWSEALRQELQPDIRVTLIEPGAVATELTDHITHAEAKQGADSSTRNWPSPPKTSPRSSRSQSPGRDG